jgi:hypothetical protein
MPIDSSKCSFRSTKGLCMHKQALKKPCGVDQGRDDLCPRSLVFNADQAAEKEDAGER